MNKTLTYDEWRAKFSVNITDEARISLKELHNLDADKEVEAAMRKEYEFYLNHGTGE